MPVETRSTSSRREDGEETTSHEEESGGTTTSATETSGTATDEKTETTTTSTDEERQQVPTAVQEAPRIAYLRAQLEEARLRTELARAIYEERQTASYAADIAVSRVEDWVQSAQPGPTDGQPAQRPLAITQVVALAPHNLPETATASSNEEAADTPQRSAGKVPAYREVVELPQKGGSSSALTAGEPSAATMAATAARAVRPADQQTSVGGEANNSSPNEENIPQQESGTLKAADITALASALAQVSRGGPRYCIELPSFDGTGEEWLHFKAAYRDTEKYFSKAENRARIRKCLKGNAKEAVSCLFYGETDPNQIIEHLEIQFGRPDALVNTELEKIKALTRVKESAKETCVFASKVNNIVATIIALNRESYLHDTVAINSLLAKFNYTLQHSWFQYARREARKPDLQMISEFLMKEAEMCAALVPHETPKDHPPVNRRIQRTHTQQSDTASQRDRCAICQDAHNSAICEKFAKANIDERWQLAKRNNLCFRCLQYRKPRHECKYRACGIEGCKNSHNRRLHRNRTEKPAETPGDQDAVVMSALSSAPRAYLKVIPIILAGSQGSVNTFALLDEGSTVTLIEENVAKRIGARGPVEPFRIETVGGARLNAERSRRVEVTIRGLHHQQKHRIIGRTIRNLNLSPQSVNRAIVNKCRHLVEIEQDVIMERAVPTVLIGQDNWHLIVSRAVRSGPRGQPVASLTNLGWVLHGVDHRQKQRVHLVQRAAYADRQEDIEQVIRRHFDLDNIGITPRQPINHSEQRALRILEETSKRLPDGRFVTGLLWKEDSREVPDSRGMALKRLHTNEKRLDKNPALKEAYDRQVQHVIDSGYAELAHESPAYGLRWYLPHFAVVNPAKPKPRIVYDAAARINGVSLNDMLLAGPDLLQSLPGVLMRFRQLPIAVTADIKEMFLQIRIREEDRDALRFLWRGNDRVSPPREYRMTSVVFGATSSPSTAIFIKNKNAEEYAHQYPSAATAVVKNHYMDDYLQSFDNEEEAATIASQVSAIHKKAHFQLCGWKSNSTALLQKILAEPSSGGDLELHKDSTKVLGLKWKPQGDKLGFNVAVLHEKATLTKRHALRVAMSIFDPLGLIAPITIHAKRFLQETWRIGLQWDEPLPSDLEKIWREWLHEVGKMENLEIPRAHSNMARATDKELHVFTDASESAYAAAVYWRITNEKGEISIHLAAAKGRVSPLKFTSIPRLELQAALLGARLARHVLEEYEYQPSRRYYWTDSRTVLSWLRTGSRSFKPFVAHRVAEIEEITKVSEWRWVPSRENVADDATRQIPVDFDDKHRWFVGPAFLYKSASHWPAEGATSSEKTQEEKSHAAAEYVNNVKIKHVSNIIESLPDIRRFSSWLRLIRATARVLQFVQVCKRRRECAASLRKRTLPRKREDSPWRGSEEKGTRKKRENIEPAKFETKTTRYLPVDGADIERAELLWLRACQEEALPTEIAALKSGTAIAKDSRVKSIAIFLDEKGIIRLKSRISAAEGIPKEQREPAILDGRHPYVRLLINKEHRRLHHSGVEAIVGELLQKYWVIGLRPTVRTVVKSCVLCRKRRAVPPQPPTGDLPKARVAHHQRAFTYVGLDYFGPLSVTIGRRHEKRYVALFTCMTTRAVHLEIAATLTTDSAVMALRRMMSRRGCPAEIWSDNGTNFHGADTELRRAAYEATKEAAANYSVRWRFIPPGAPFMGGAWERMVRSVKTALYAVLKERHPPEEVLHTLLVEVEHTLNSRPLSHVSVSPEDPEPLTPHHFILGGSSRVPLPGAFTERDTIGRKHWRHSQQLANQFWSRWMREVLPLLQQRREPTGRGAELRDGDVVLIADGALPRNTWPTGVIEAVHPGADGVVRVADIRTAAGVMRRPVRKLIWLHHKEV